MNKIKKPKTKERKMHEKEWLWGMFIIMSVLIPSIIFGIRYNKNKISRRRIKHEKAREKKYKKKEIQLVKVGEKVFDVDEADRIEKYYF